MHVLAFVSDVDDIKKMNLQFLSSLQWFMQEDKSALRFLGSISNPPLPQCALSTIPPGHEITLAL